MKPNRIPIAHLTLLAGLLLAAPMVRSMPSLAVGLPSGETPQVAKLPYSLFLDATVRPAGQPVKAVQMSRAAPRVSSLSASTGASIITGTGWQKIMIEDFEGDFPAPGWALYDDSETDGGEYLWDKRDCKAFSDDYSVWAGAGGLHGGTLTCTETYTNNLDTWLDYGPVDLSQVTDAEMQLALWTDLEWDGFNLIDKVSWMASPDGLTYYGYVASGETGDWVPESLNLSDIPPAGDLTGQAAVYLGWIFESDAVNPIAYEGAFVDDVALWVYAPPPPTPPPPTVTLPITRHTTSFDFADGRSHDGTIVQVQEGDGALALAAQADALGTWNRLPSLPRVMAGFAAVTAQGHLFIIGGNGPDGYERRVYSASIGETGLLDRWQETTSMPQALVGLRAEVANGHLFVVGGANAFGIQDTVFSAPIHRDGTLGQWSTLTPLPEPLALAGVVAAQGYLYVLGGQGPGFSVSNTIYRAAINADGTLGDWSALPHPLPTAPVGMSGLNAFVALTFNDHLYILGGNDLALMWDGVFRAPIGADGSLGAWEVTSPLPKTLAHQAGIVTRGGILIAGGYSANDTASQKAVYWAAVQPDGSLGSWTVQPDFYYPALDGQLVASEAHAFILGGRNLQNRYFSSVLAVPFQTTTQVLVGNFNHQFELGQSHFIKDLQWEEIGSLGQIQVRYRIAGTESVFGPWSVFTSSQPIAINLEGTALEYQILYQRQDDSANDKVVTQVQINLGPSEESDDAIAGLSAVNDSPTPLGQATTLTATITAGSNVTYTWDFGDGDTGSGPIVIHTYPSIGTVTATVTVSNSVSLDTIATTVIVSPYYVYLPLVLSGD